MLSKFQFQFSEGKRNILDGQLYKDNIPSSKCSCSAKSASMGAWVFSDSVLLAVLLKYPSWYIFVVMNL